MKKLLVILTFAILSVGAYAQAGHFSGHIKGGLQTDPARFGLGVEGRYNITQPIRVAADMLFMFPKDHVTGLSVNLNAHYVFNITSKIDLYPLAGLNMENGRYSYKGFSNSSTKWGFNLGGGIDYNLTEKTYLNAEFKYTIASWDRAHIMFGYGFRF